MEVDFARMLWAVGAVGMRVTGVLLLAPALGGVAVPARVKVALTVALTVLLCPSGAGLETTRSVVGWVGLAAGEFVVGLVLGLVLQFVFEAAQFAGNVLGVQMGFSLVNVMDPQTQVDTPVLAIFHQLVTLLVFLQLNVHHWLLRGLARSFRYLPAGSFAINGAAIDVLLRQSGGIFLAGIEMAAPALAATVLADVALGFLGKASPHLPVLFVGLSVKSVLGMAVVVAALASWPRYLEQQFLRAMEAGERMLALAH